MQEGSEGWRVAQERAVWEGWAGEVMGARGVRVAGRVVGARGKRMGDMKGLGSVSRWIWVEKGGTYGHLRRDISARLSTIVFVLGQGRELGYEGGRRWT